MKSKYIFLQSALVEAFKQGCEQAKIHCDSSIYFLVGWLEAHIAMGDEKILQELKDASEDLHA